MNTKLEIEMIETVQEAADLARRMYRMLRETCYSRRHARALVLKTMYAFNAGPYGIVRCGTRHKR